MKHLKSFILIIFAFFAGTVIALGTTFVLAHGGDTNLVHACVRNNTILPGAANIRIVGANTNCNSNETALDWPKTAGSGSSETPVSVGGGMSGRWDGTITMPAGLCSPGGTYDVRFVLVQDSDGNLTGALRTGDATQGVGFLYASSALTGLVNTSSFEIEGGATSHQFSGNIVNTNNINGTVYPGDPSQCDSGTFSAQRVPLVP
jgi:hypothetical protein